MLELPGGCCGGRQEEGLSQAPSSARAPLPLPEHLGEPAGRDQGLEGQEWRGGTSSG